MTPMPELEPTKTKAALNQLDQLKQDVREGRIDANRLVDLLATAPHGRAAL
jgi:hypothetical protein